MEFLYSNKDVEELAELMGLDEDKAEEFLRVAQGSGIAGPDAIGAIKAGLESITKDAQEAHSQEPHEITHAYPYGTLTFRIEEGKAAITSADITSEHVALPRFVEDKYGNSVVVTEIVGAAFSNQQKLKYLVIQEGVEKIADSAFAYSGSILDIVFPSTLKELGAALWNVPQYENNEGGVVYYAGTPEQFEAMLRNGSARMMMDYTPYEEIVRYIEGVDAYQVPEVDFRLAYDEDDEYKEHPFAQLRVCNQRGDVIIPEAAVVGGAELPVREIGRSSFSGNESVTSVVIPPSVKRIHQDAFYKCVSLTEVDVLAGEGEIEIGVGAFYMCESLGDVHLRREAKVERYAFGGASRVNLIEYC